MATGEQPAPGPENITAAPTAQAAANPEAAPTAIQGGESDRIVLPPMPPKRIVPPEALLRRVRILDGILVILLLAFAFLAASFRAHNSDLFQHLATGRLIANGEYEFGKDPFTFTSEGRWINHSWFLDVLAYFVYQLGSIGGVVLVILKALLVTGLAWLLLRTASLPGRTLWIPVLCAMLAILVASPRFLLQPSTVSLVLLGLTLFLLVRVGSTSRWIWALPAVCLVWVNVDEWFFLGPLTIALFVLGEFLDRTRVGEGAVGKTDLRTLGLVLVASLVACLVNPHHVRAFVLPPPLDPALALGSVAKNPQFRVLFLSPLESIYFHPNIGLSAAGLAYFLLVVLGLASFLVTFPVPPAAKGQAATGWRWWRVTVFLVFLLLSVWNARMIPFFAVLAGPITALNFLDFAARQFGPGFSTEPGWQRWAISGRLFTIFVVLLVGAAAVPGYLQAQPQQYRQVGFGIEIDPALKGAAEQVVDWHREGLVTGEEKWFNTTLEAAHYLDWFCADEKGRPLAPGFIDLRLSLFPSATVDFSAMRRSLSGEDLPSDFSPGQAPPPPVWRKIMAKRGVRFLAYHASDIKFVFTSSLQHLYANPQEWQPCYANGRTALFEWRNPEEKNAPPFDTRLAMDFDRLAFGPDAEQAPATRARSLSELPWWREFIEVETPLSLDGSTAVQNLARYEALGLQYLSDHNREALAMMAARVIGAAAAPGCPATNGMLLPLRLDLAYLPRTSDQPPPQPMDQAAMYWLEWCRSLQDAGPVSSLYLTIRAARRAIHENPEDIRAYLELGAAYTQLSKHTREYGMVRPRPTVDLMPAVGLIRQSQIVTAYVSLLALKPNPDIAQLVHRRLVEAFPAPEYLEPRIGHYREYLRLTQTLGRMPGVSKEQFRERLDQLETEVKGLERLLKNRRDQYEVNALTKPLLHKVRIAQENGLPETALNLLLKADPKDLMDQQNPQESRGPMVAVHLLLGLGRLDEARKVLAPDESKNPVDKRGFGVHPLVRIPAYEWFLTQMAASSGDYEEADQALSDSIKMLESNPGIRPLLARLDIVPFPEKEVEESLSVFAAYLVGDYLLAEAPLATKMPWQILQQVPYRLHPPAGLKRPGPRATLVMGGQFLTQTLQQQASLWTLRAWLALEQGRIDRVREYAEKAISLSDVGPGVAKNTRRRMAFSSQPLAYLCLQLIDLQGKKEK